MNWTIKNLFLWYTIKFNLTLPPSVYKNTILIRFNIVAHFVQKKIRIHKKFKLLFIHSFVSRSNIWKLNVQKKLTLKLTFHVFIWNFDEPNEWSVRIFVHFESDQVQENPYFLLSIFLFKKKGVVKQRAPTPRWKAQANSTGWVHLAL